MKNIHLTKEELTYMHEAINEWHAGALQHIESMKNYKYDDKYDGYDPMPPGKCIMYTEAQIKNVKSWTSELDANWEKNKGEIELNFFCSRILKYSVHKNMQSIIFLSIKQKVDTALEVKADENRPLQKKSLFAASQEASEKKIDSTSTNTNPPGGLKIQ
jgi:hypothetical protein